MSVEFDRTYQYGSGLTVRYAHINDEPSIYMTREMFGHRYSYVLGLDLAYTIADDETLMEKAFLVSHVLGLDQYWTTIKRLCDILQNHIDELIQLPPAPVKDGKKMIEEAIEHHGLKFKVNGETVVG